MNGSRIATIARTLTGTGLVALGATVMAGWLLRVPALVQVLPGATATVFTTALGFVLAGVALIALERGRPAIALACAGVLLLAAAAKQAQNLFGVDLGSDWPSLHAWLKDGNPYPGRASLPTSICFAVFAVAIVLTARRVARPAWLPAALAWLLIGLAGANLVAHLRDLEDMLAALSFPRMGLLTSAGMLALGFGLLCGGSLHRPAARERITATAALLLASISAVAGLVTLAVMEERMRSALSESLLNRLHGRADVLEYVVRDGERTARAVGGAPGIVRSLRQSMEGRSPRAADLEVIQASAQNFVDIGVSTVLVRAPDGRVLAHAGQPPSAPLLLVPLGALEHSTLGWDGRMVLRTEFEIRDAGGIIGSALVEQLLPDLTLVSGSAMQLGETGEMVLCAPIGERLRCFPSRLNPRVFEIPRAMESGQLLPMALALSGRSGVARVVDYRGQTVLAAHAPVGSLGLGMVLKMDLAEIYLPIRDRLLMATALLAALVVAGTLLLRARIRPLVERLVHAEDAAREHAGRLKAITDNVPALVAYLDEDNRFRFVNGTYEKWFGLRSDQMIGRTMREVWGEKRHRKMEPLVERVRAGETVAFDTTLRGAGGERHVRGNYLPERDASGRVRGMYVLVSDVTELVEGQRKLHNARERLQFALDGSSTALWDTDLLTRSVVLSERWAQLLDEPPGETRTTIEQLMALVHPDDLRDAVDNSLRALSGEIAEYAVEHRVRVRDGRWIWILSRGKVVERDPASGRALRMAGTNVDITAGKLVQQRLQQLAHYDTLTGAANRALFEDRLRQAIGRARRGDTAVALMYLDIDRFKAVNDSLGHAAGDALLKAFVARVRGCVRETDTIGRLGGDEFAVLLEGLKDDEGVSRVAQKVLEAMREPVSAGGVDLTVTTSIGVAMLRGAGAEDADAFAKRADGALYAAKAAGRNTFRVSNALP